MADGKRRGARAAQRVREWLMEYAYLVMMCAMAAMVAASAMYADRIRTENAANVPAHAQAQEIAASPSPTIKPTPLPTIAAATASPLFARRQASVWPVSGGVLRGFSAEAIEWPTLSCIKPHEGVDIAGEPDESVLCALDGVVEKTVRDELWGWRVTVRCTDGSVCEYAGLALCAVTQGERVARGRELGTLLACIPCEAEMDAHLHLTLHCAGAPVDPLGAIVKQE